MKNLNHRGNFNSGLDNALLFGKLYKLEKQEKSSKIEEKTCQKNKKLKKI